MPFKGPLYEGDINAITYDSRKVKPGTLFIAISGMKNDGHNYIPEAIEKGAVAIVVNEGRYINENIPILQVQDPRLAMSHISAKFYGDPSYKMNIIGVTGTNGKTSITHIIHHILQKNNISCGTLGTLGFQSPSGLISTGFTTPESVELQQMLNTLLIANIENVVMEISSHALNLHRVDDIDVNIAIFSNLSPEHLDFHGDMDSYFKEKLKLFTKLNEKDTAILNSDDPYSRKISKKTKAKIITYGMNSDADLHAIKKTYSLEGIQYEIKYHNDIIQINTNLLGEYNLYNLMASIATCLSMNINLNNIKDALQCRLNIPGRMELVPCDSPGKVFIDYAHTPDACEKIFSTLSSLSYNGKKIYTVFGCGGNRDRHNRTLMANIIEKYSNYIIITTDNPRDESIEKINSDIINGLAGSNYEIILDRKKAIYKIIDRMEEKSILVVIGKGVENYQEIGSEKIPYNDKETIQRYGYES